VGLDRGDLDGVAAEGAVRLPAGILDQLDQPAREHGRAGRSAARGEALAHRHDVWARGAVLELERPTDSPEAGHRLVSDPQRAGLARQLRELVLVGGGMVDATRL
jgi:hypothetical protein